MLKERKRDKFWISKIIKIGPTGLDMAQFLYLYVCCMVALNEKHLVLLSYLYSQQ